MAAKLERTKPRHLPASHRGLRGRTLRLRVLVVWKHRGSQHTATFRTLAEGREAKEQAGRW